MFTLSISTDNAAFEDLHAEVARLLRAAAVRVEMGRLSGNLTDFNGNVVGQFSDKF